MNSFAPLKLIYVNDSSDLEEIRISKVDEADATETWVQTIDDLGKKKLLFNIAEEVMRAVEESARCIVIIDQYQACADEGFEWLQRNAGIALIKFLRMMEVKHHIVLITPYADNLIQLVREDPANLIVTSKGITCRSRLDEIRETSLTELETLAALQFGDQDLRPYLKVDFELPQDERHNWANWWGVDRLWLVHHIVKSDGSKNSLERITIDNYPSSLIDRLKQLRNYQALFLYGQSDRTILLKILSVKALLKKLEVTIALNNELRMISIDEQNKLKIELTVALRAIEDLNEISQMEGDEARLNLALDSFIELDERLKLRANIISLDKIINQYLDDIFKMRFDTNTQKKSLEKLGSIINQIREIVPTSKVYPLLHRIYKNVPKVLYIDDQANEGWSNIFQHIIYNKKVSEEIFKVIQPGKGDIINEDYYHRIVKKELDSPLPNIILLDLRLKGETGIRMDVKNLSGAYLLRKIHDEFPFIPIIMITASNKYWSYETLIELGCKGYWSKEGVDVMLNEEDSIQNYMRFVGLIYQLTPKAPQG